MRVLKSWRTKFIAILLLTRIQTTNQENPVGPDNSLLSEGALELIEKSTRLLGLVNAHPGDYMGREIDTRTKQRPSRNDIDNINRAVNEPELYVTY